VDCDMAYINARLKGPPTYASMHKRIRPRSWAGFTDPVTRVLRALYGMPRSGGDWDEEICGIVVTHLGMTKIKDTEGSMYMIQVAGGDPCLLVIYVDDLIFGGPGKVVNDLIEKLEKKVDLKRSKGIVESVLGMHFHAVMKKDKLFVRIEMCQYIGHMLEEYKGIIGLGENGVLKKAYVPEYAEGYDFGTDSDTVGDLVNYAKRLVGKALYLVRAYRVDAMHAVVAMAADTGAWTRASDLKMHRFMSYINATRDYVLEWVYHPGNGLKGAYLHARSDADHGSCETTRRSTSGWVMWLVLPGEDDKDNTEILLDWGCKRQTKAALSTAEAETNATSDSWTRTLLPAGGTFDQILKRKVALRHDTDSESSRAAIIKGVSVAMRYMRKNHALSIAVLHDMAQGIDFRICKSEENESDILTKPLPRQVVERHREALGVRRPGREVHAWAFGEGLRNFLKDKIKPYE